MLSTFTNRFHPLALTLLRLALGIIFLYHGSVKISDLTQWAQNFVHMGFPGWVAYFIGPLEAICGLLLIVGFFSRVAALLLAGDMLVALLRVHLPHSPITHVAGYELPMVLSAASFAIFCFGPGPVSVDRLRRDNGAV